MVLSACALEQACRTGNGSDRVQIEYFSSQRLRLRFATWGDPAYPALILLHGGRDHARSWDGFAALAAERYRIIAPDLRGHGGSEWASDGAYAIEDYLLDLAELLDHLAIPRAALIGHSLGGNVALRFAGLFPDKVTALIAIEGLGPAPDQALRDDRRDRLETLAMWIEDRRAVQSRTLRAYGDLAEAVARLQALNPSLRDDVARHLAEHGTICRDDGGISFRFDPAVIVDAPFDLTLADKHRLWGRVSAPVLLVYGADSWASDPARDGRLAKFANARSVLLPEAGHWVHLDQPDAFAAAAFAFLGEVL